MTRHNQLPFLPDPCHNSPTKAVISKARDGWRSERAAKRQAADAISNCLISDDENG